MFLSWRFLKEVIPVILRVLIHLLEDSRNAQARASLIAEVRTFCDALPEEDDDGVSET